MGAIVIRYHVNICANLICYASSIYMTEYTFVLYIFTTPHATFLSLFDEENKFNKHYYLIYSITLHSLHL